MTRFIFQKFIFFECLIEKSKKNGNCIVFAQLRRIEINSREAHRWEKKKKTRKRSWEKRRHVNKQVPVWDKRKMKWYDDIPHIPFFVNKTMIKCAALAWLRGQRFVEKILYCCNVKTKQSETTKTKGFICSCADEKIANRRDMHVMHIRFSGRDSPGHTHYEDTQTATVYRLLIENRNL